MILTQRNIGENVRCNRTRKRTQLCVLTVLSYGKCIANYNYMRITNKNHFQWLTFLLKCFYFNTRKSSCVNARDILTAVYSICCPIGWGGEVLGTLGYPPLGPGQGGRYLGWRGRYLEIPLPPTGTWWGGGGGKYLGWGHWYLGVPLPPIRTWLGYPLSSSQDLVVGGRYLGQRGVGTLGYPLPLSGPCRARYLWWGGRYLEWG